MRCDLITDLVAVDDMLMPSTPSAYPQVVSHTFASFHVGQFSCFRSSAQFLSLVRFPAAPQRKSWSIQKPWPAFYFINISVKICHPGMVQKRGPSDAVFG
jgi:hypothetical protein